MKHHRSLTVLLVSSVLAAGITLGATQSPASTSAATPASSARAAAAPKQVAPSCRRVLLAGTDRYVLRPLGCVLRCRRKVRVGSRRVVRLVPCRRPARPTVLAPQESGLVGATGTGTSARITTRAATTVPAKTSGPGAPGAGTASTLILYDTTSDYGWLGELYAMSVANLASHFGSWTARPVSTYTAGMLDAYTATIYIGSTYDEPIPTAFLDDAYTTTKPVVWIYDNIWALAGRHPDFTAKYGWQWWMFDTSDVAKVTYKGTSLSRSLLNRGGIMNYASVDTSKATVLATATRADGTTFPWALRSGNLTYIGENPLTYTTETDRDIAFADLLFDALAPATPTRHRALVRIEDITPDSDPAELRAVADVLAGRRIPFGFGVSAEFRDPLKVLSSTTRRTMAHAPQVVSAIKYMQSRGGVMVNHGLTHQYSNVPNPYDGVSGDDFEFYRVTENLDHTLNFAGPVAEDSLTWATQRISAADAGFRAAGLASPKIFEFPHYSSSVNGYNAAKSLYATRWERSLYFSGLLRGGTINYARPIGQRFPYVVRDIYGSTVLPENIGSYEPEPFYQFPVHTVDDIVAGADANMVVRDGIAAMYYHPFWGTQPLTQAVDRLKAKGWTFVSPTTLM